ncbi:MAG: sigma-70 family RNA polymerase sigma factor [Lachnospiraceae bacterium]|nr:sigma-70 family RNA polymerase sigma factor [Lachnospiraceae bacterium]
MMQDEQIVELYFQRNERALLETSDKYGNYCKTIARNILHDEESSKECMNDTLYQSWNTIPPTRPSSLKAYVGRIIRNLSLNRWEHEHALKRGGGETALAYEELGECIADGLAQSAEQLEESMVIRNVMDRILDGLTVQNRRIFVRRYWYCSSVKEIALAFGLSENSVTKSLSRIRNELRNALEKAGVVL